MNAAVIEGTLAEELTEEELAEARRYSLLIQWSPVDGLWIATAQELGAITTHGASPVEAAEMGAEMVATALAGMRAAGDRIPAPSLFGQ